MGYRVATVCSAAPELAPIREQLTQAGVEVHVLPEEALSVQARIRRSVWFISLLRRYRRGILVLLLGNHRSGAPVVLAGRAARMSAIVRADLQPPEPPFHWWRDRIGLNLLDLLVDAVVVGSRESKEMFIKDTGRTKRKFSVIHTGIDLSRYSPDS